MELLIFSVWNFSGTNQRVMSSKGFQFKYLFNGYHGLCDAEDHVEIHMDGEIGLLLLVLYRLI